MALNMNISGKEKSYPNGRCCVFQPFDSGGPFDKRFDDVIKPALENAGLEAYRVDRDPSTVIPIDTLHTEIQSAKICLADFSNRNPNVMYEIGYAFAAGKEVILLTDKNGEKFPFDLQHRTITQYSRDSTKDFVELGKQITERALALVNLAVNSKHVADAITTDNTDGLLDHEAKALAFIFAASFSNDDSVPATLIKERMASDAYINDIGTRVAISGLLKKMFIERKWDYAGHPENGYWVYKITSPGELWMQDNQDRFNFNISPNPKSTTESIF